MSFLQGSLDLFSGKRTSHMGSYQYVDHTGMRNGRSTSGAKLWAEIESSELNSDSPNLFNAEEVLLKQVAAEIDKYVPTGAPVLELGPGTPLAFEKKTSLIIHAIKSGEYIFVDESRAFLNQIATCNALAGVKATPIEDDFFEDEYCYCDGDEEAVVCMFGSTISNILNPLSKNLPEKALVEHLKKLAQTLNKGWLLISCDASQNGRQIKTFYKRQSLFQLNVFDRMAAELPVDESFDTTAFDYEPEWLPDSSQLGHVAVLNRDMQFTMAGRKIVLRAGQKLHLKNSYKFTPAFFEKCCNQAGLDVVKIWSNSSPTKIYLLKKLPLQSVQPSIAA